VTGSVPHSGLDEKSSFQLTRELELLISAGLVFALLQLPDVLEAWWMRTSVHVGGTAFGIVFMLYYVGKLVSYGLIAAIAGHFLLRGFWVAIMGLRSVYPAGVIREKLDHGTVYRKFYDNRLATLAEIEDRVDRVAASIFAFVFLFLLIFLMMIVWTIFAGVLAFLARGITGRDDVVMPVLLAVFLVYSLLTWFVAAVDKRTKKHEVSPATETLALRILRGLYYASFNFLYAPVFFTFASHSSRRRMSALLVTFLYSMIAIFMLSVFYTRGLIGFDSYAYYPA
jgi:hypothetical protein